MSDNTITVSAIDRSKVCINDKPKVNCRGVQVFGQHGGFEILLRCGDPLESHHVGSRWIYRDLLWPVLVLVLGRRSGDYVIGLCAGALISFPDWRNFMTEEAEALLHSSKDTNKFLKSFLVIVLILVISIAQFACTIAVVDGVNWYAVFMNSLADTFSPLPVLDCTRSALVN
jgi:hypothetical protein